MAVFPGALWRGDCANNGPGPRTRTRGAVLHVNDGPDVSLWSWVNNPSSDMSCHFQIRLDGSIEQYLDTNLLSWCQRAGNNDWVSIEMPTHPDTGMTAAQIASCARVLAWLAKLYRFPLQLTSDPYGAGFGWHGMGAAAGVDWGHALCPGEIRVAQRAQIISAATKHSTAQEDDVPYSDWPAADKAALAADLTKAIITRPLGGYDSPETLGQALVSASQGARAASTALNDTTQGLLVQVARVQQALAGLPDAVAGKISNAPSGTIDVASVAKAAVREALDELAAALTAQDGAPA